MARHRGLLRTSLRRAVIKTGYRDATEVLFSRPPLRVLLGPKAGKFRAPTWNRMGAGAVAPSGRVSLRVSLAHRWCNPCGEVIARLSSGGRILEGVNNAAA